MAANRVCQRCNKLTNMYYVSNINKQRLCYLCKVHEDENAVDNNEKHAYKQTNWSQEKDNL